MEGRERKQVGRRSGGREELDLTRGFHLRIALAPAQRPGGAGVEGAVSLSWPKVAAAWLLFTTKGCDTPARRLAVPALARFNSSCFIKRGQGLEQDQPDAQRPSSCREARRGRSSAENSFREMTLTSKKELRRVGTGTTTKEAVAKPHQKRRPTGGPRARGNTCVVFTT